jgi:hypothetical protein
MRSSGSGSTACSTTKGKTVSSCSDESLPSMSARTRALSVAGRQSHSTLRIHARTHALDLTDGWMDEWVDGALMRIVQSPANTTRKHQWRDEHVWAHRTTITCDRAHARNSARTQHASTHASKHARTHAQTHTGWADRRMDGWCAGQTAPRAHTYT